MALSATLAIVPTIDEVVLDAYKKAGLLPIQYGIGTDTQWNALAAHGRRTLNRLLAQKSTERFFAYFRENHIQDLTAGVHQYVMDADILSIIDDGSYIPASNDPEEEETTGETPVKPISEYRWNQLSSKASQGTPVHYYVERNHQNSGSELTLRVWPVPNEAGKIRFRTHRIPRSSSVGGNNPDFKRHWEQWAVLALAYELMTDSSMPLDERMNMRRDADVAFELLKSYDSDNTAPDVVFVHGTPWSGRCL